MFRLISYCTVFFFNESAATEIYPYWHTFSLHGALPVCSALILPKAGSSSCAGRGLDMSFIKTRWRPPGWIASTGVHSRSLTRGGRKGCVHGQSEEHTSELQSLMRISYAVFCLKKKKIQDHKKQTENEKHS